MCDYDRLLQSEVNLVSLGRGGAPLGAVLFVYHIVKVTRYFLWRDKMRIADPGAPPGAETALFKYGRSYKKKGYEDNVMQDILDVIGGWMCFFWVSVNFFIDNRNCYCVQYGKEKSLTITK